MNIKIIWSLILLFSICTSCKTNEDKFKEAYKSGEYEKAATIYETYLYQNENEDEISNILYYCYKNILDDVFNWSGPVVIIDSSSLSTKQLNYIHKFELLLQTQNKRGLLGGVKFRLGNFYDAFELYSSIYHTNENKSVKEDFKASLSGILLGDKFQFANHSKLYYESDKIFNSFNDENICSICSEYINRYYQISNNICAINILVNNQETLDSLISKYYISKEQQTEMYEYAVDNNNWSRVEVLRQKIGDEAILFHDICTIYKLYEDKDYQNIQKRITEFKMKNRNNSLYDCLVNIIMFNTKVKTNELSGIIDDYIEIEEFYYDNDDEMYDKIKNKSERNVIETIADISSEISNNREIMDALIRENSFIEDEIIKRISSPNDIPSVVYSLFHEMLLRKYIFNRNYEGAYKLSNKMIENLSYLKFFSEENLNKINDILEIISMNNKNQLLLLKANILSQIKPEMMLVTERYEVFKSEQGSIFFLSVKSEIERAAKDIEITLNKERYKNLFYFYNNQISIIKNSFDLGKKIANVFEKPAAIFADKINFDKIQYDKNEIYEFFNYKKNLTYSNLHYMLIKLNLLLECTYEKQDNDFIYYYFAAFFPEIIQYYSSYKVDSNINERDKNKIISKCINQINIGSKDKNQIYYYSLLKNKFEEIQKKKFFNQIII